MRRLILKRFAAWLTRHRSTGARPSLRSDTQAFMSSRFAWVNIIANRCRRMPGMHRIIDYLLRLGKQNRVRGAQRSYVIRLLIFFTIVVASQTVPSSFPSTAVHPLSFSSTTYTCSVSNTTGATATRTFTPANATPNDATDDFTAIQTAINHASNAGG